MSLSSGERLGPYEILATRGAGGMGEVYAAKDSRLDRQVAIKVIGSEAPNQPQLRERFEREARAISSLNHPNICTLHDVGDYGGRTYLVLEYVEGETLAERLQNGPIPFDQALQCAIEIADALDCAHRQGVVHRDLKPSNIMLTKTGAKLLDFGLAKLMEVESAGIGGLSAASTRDQPLTAEGAIVGTLGYMAPEQLEGKDIDARTDIFAFGTILYEMLTGRAAFQGDSQASLIAAVLGTEPAPLSALQPATPSLLDRIVKQCLAKNPDDRWQSARDLANELRWIAAGEDQGTMPPAGAAARKGRERLAWLVAALLGVVAIGVALSGAFRRAPEQRIVRLSMVMPDNVSLSVAAANTALSPDGRIVAFVGTDSTGISKLWVRSLASSAARWLPGTEGAILPFWSPDGRFVAFFVLTEGKLKKVGLTGEAAQIVCDAPNGRGGTWSKDDVILFAPDSGGAIFRVSAGGGNATPVTTLDPTRGEAAHRYPFFLPDGRHFLYVTLPARKGLVATRVGSLDTKETRELVHSVGGAIYAEPGYLLFSHEQAIVAQPFDPQRLQLTGEMQSTGLSEGEQDYYTGAPVVSAATKDVLVLPGAKLPHTRVVWLDRDGNEVGAVELSPARYRGLRLAPSGEQVAVVRQATLVTTDIWVVDLSREVATRLTFDPSWNLNPVWSPDERHVAFSSDRSGNRDLYRRLATGGGAAEALVSSPGLFSDPTDWSPDGRFVVYHSLVPETGYDIWLFPVDGSSPVAFLATPFNERGAAVSPDGRWIAYQSDESGTPEIYVQSFPTPGSKHRITRHGGRGAWWRQDGSELMYYTADDAVMSVPLQVSDSIRPGEPRLLFKFPENAVAAAMRGDGERFLASVAIGENESQALTVVLNWTAALQH